jgi:prepilin-type N-terminal cleavage/methylation domain-containing protein
MISLNIKQEKRNQGFTIVELLIVIVVIGILAAIVIVAYSGITAKGRDGQRVSDVAAIVTQLEAYKSDSGNYPSLLNLNSPAWRTTNMKGLDGEAIVDPSTACDPTISTTCVKAAPAPKSYAYAVSDMAGATCEADATTCVQYTLTATYEKPVNGKSTLIKKNLD